MSDLLAKDTGVGSCVKDLLRPRTTLLVDSSLSSPTSQASAMSRVMSWKFGSASAADTEGKVALLLDELECELDGVEEEGLVAAATAAAAAASGPRRGGMARGIAEGGPVRSGKIGNNADEEFFAAPQRLPHGHELDWPLSIPRVDCKAITSVVA